MARFSHKIDTRHPYVPAASTDIRKTLNKERRRLAEIAEREKAKPVATVRQLKKAEK